MDFCTHWYFRHITISFKGHTVDLKELQMLIDFVGWKERKPRLSCSEQIMGSFRVPSFRDALTLTLLLLAALKITKFFSGVSFYFSSASHALLDCSAIKVRHKLLCRFQWVWHTWLCGSFSWSICPVNLWNCPVMGTGQALGPLGTGNIGITENF